MANQGISAQDRKEIRIADDPVDFAQAVIELLMNDDMRWFMADHARRFVEEHYSWEHNLAALDKAIAAAVGHQDSPEEALEEVASA